MTIASAVRPAEWVPERYRKPIFIVNCAKFRIFAASSAPEPVMSNR